MQSNLLKGTQRLIRRQENAVITKYFNIRGVSKCIQEQGVCMQPAPTPLRCVKSTRVRGCVGALEWASYRFAASYQPAATSRPKAGSKRLCVRL